jgi:hypothetical protein
LCSDISGEYRDFDPAIPSSFLKSLAIGNLPVTLSPRSNRYFSPPFEGGRLSKPLSPITAPVQSGDARSVGCEVMIE